jgi:hypothetical protein
VERRLGHSAPTPSVEVANSMNAVEMPKPVSGEALQRSSESAAAAAKIADRRRRAAAEDAKDITRSCFESRCYY